MQLVDDRAERFDEAYRKLFPTVFRVAYRVSGDHALAEDLCHEAFIKYYERKEPFPDLDQTKYWLIRVVRNISLNYEKKKGRERKSVERLQKTSPQYQEADEERLLHNETRNAVQQALGMLPYNLRIVLVLKEYTGMNYREIGKTLGISEGNVKVRVFRARERLAKLFKEGRVHVP
jgi:RNA polymerase sigma-70 factor (ECF subfamily)